MKKLILAILPFILIMNVVSCQSNIKRKPVERKPVEGKAYFFGQFIFSHVNSTPRGIPNNLAIRFKREEGKPVFVRSSLRAQYKLIEVEPGTYSNDFFFYSGGPKFWRKEILNKYKVDKILQQPFRVEKNTIYFVGNFNQLRWTFPDNYRELLDERFPEFKQLPIIKAYNQLGPNNL